jgi:hypothetical protein
VSLYVVKIMLRSGQLQELAFDGQPQAQKAFAALRDAQERPGASAMPLVLTDQFGHDFSVLAGDVAGCAFADLEAETQFAVKVEMLRATARQDLLNKLQAEQAGRARLLVPSGLLPSGPTNGSASLR